MLLEELAVLSMFSHCIHDETGISEMGRLRLFTARELDPADQFGPIKVGLFDKDRCASALKADARRVSLAGPIDPTSLLGVLLGNRRRSNKKTRCGKNSKNTLLRETQRRDGRVP